MSLVVQGLSAIVCIEQEMHQRKACIITVPVQEAYTVSVDWSVVMAAKMPVLFFELYAVLQVDGCCLSTKAVNSKAVSSLKNAG